jgi:uncharacterized membrane protein YfcA
MSSTLLFYLSYLGLGVVAGTLAGLLGVGGGLVIVPTLAYLFEAQGIAPEATLHLALGTSLGTIAFTSLSSTRAHHQHGNVNWGLVARITPGILVGTYLGGTFAAHLGTSTLKTVFAVFLLTVALQMLSGIKPRPTRTVPNLFGSTVAGTLIGGVSGVVGIGGGSMSVPFMLWCNVETRRAVGTSAAIGFPIAVSGAISYGLNGRGASTDVAHTLGYLHVPALIGIALLSVLTAPLGARLATNMDPAKLKRGFAFMLFVIGAKMLWAVLHK